MNTLQKIMRALWLALLILIGLSGIGFMGAIFNTRERYRDKEVRIEMVDKNKSKKENEMQIEEKI